VQQEDRAFGGVSVSRTTSIAIEIDSAMEAG
jgi:hypothetical protein